MTVSHTEDQPCVNCYIEIEIKIVSLNFFFMSLWDGASGFSTGSSQVDAPPVLPGLSWSWLSSRLREFLNALLPGLKKSLIDFHLYGSTPHKLSQ